MDKDSIPLDSILNGDCIEVLKTLPDESVDLVFADPPYNLQLSQELWRPNQTRVDGVDDEWDKFSNFEAYDEFSRAWLVECRRILKNDGAIWVIGTYHNIFRLGTLMQDLGYWFLNDVVWIKTNPMPNFRGVRFTNAHETLIWACKEKRGKYKFNYHTMKELNDGRQMRSDWEIPLCTGAERIKVDGKKAHSTQKPEALLYRIIVSSTHPGDTVLDPFFGTGTTGAVAKKLHRHWIGVENNEMYVNLARERLDHIVPGEFNIAVFDVRDRRHRQKRIPFRHLVENGLLIPGQPLYFKAESDAKALIKPDGKLLVDGFTGSIHQAAKHLSGDEPCNGWEVWYFENTDGELEKIDKLRREISPET
jgi:site-specific DNA-methyltransferase (adenine-specific)